MNLHRSSVQRIVKRDLHLSAFRRVPAQVISEAVKQKRHQRCQKLIRHLPLAKAKTVFFTDEKESAGERSEDRVWSAGKKRNVHECRLVAEREQSLPSTSWFLRASVLVGREECI